MTVPCQVVEPYRSLAAEYDAAIGLKFFRRVRAAFERLQQEYGFVFRSAADLGCGTGLFACYLAHKWGVPVFAVDRSTEMLAQARRVCRGEAVQFLRQDLRELRLPCRVDLVTANYDVLNHVTAPRELRLVLHRVYDHLNPGGHFYFDLITPCLGLPSARWTRWMRPTRRGLVWQFLLWQPRRSLLRINVLSERSDRGDSRMEKHLERAYSPIDVARWLAEAGFRLRGVHDEATAALAAHCTPRMLFVAQRDSRN